MSLIQVLFFDHFFPFSNWHQFSPQIEFVSERDVCVDHLDCRSYRTCVTLSSFCNWSLSTSVVFFAQNKFRLFVSGCNLLVLYFGWDVKRFQENVSTCLEGEHCRFLFSTNLKLKSIFSFMKRLNITWTVNVPKSDKINNYYFLKLTFSSVNISFLKGTNF